jgi:hypothetical protein
VKTLRLWLVLLLAVLIPVRGAVAAAMLCLPSAVPAHAEMQVEDHSHHEHADHDGAGHHAGGQCTLCSACCSSASIPSSVPRVAMPPGLVATTFPNLSAPAPTFLSDGQERPPRSI